MKKDPVFIISPVTGDALSNHFSQIKMPVKYLVTMLFLMISLQSPAQFIKGEMVLGGSLSLSMQNTPKNPEGSSYGSTSLIIDPTFGILITRNLELGISAGYSHAFSKQEYESNTIIQTNKINTDNIAASLYLQRYCVISDKFLFSITGNAGYGVGKSNSKSSSTGSEPVEDESKSYRIGAGFGPNFIFFPSVNWALRAGIGSINYIYEKNKTTDAHVNYFNISYNQIGFGFYYYFRKKAA